MATIIKMMFYPIFIGALVINIMSIVDIYYYKIHKVTNLLYYYIEAVLLIDKYNPLLTYTLRFKKVEIHPNINTDYTINRYKEGEFVNGQISINTDKLINKTVVIFHLRDPDSIDCEYFQTWTLTGICNKLKEKQQVWSRWNDSFDPLLCCRFNKILNGLIMYYSITFYVLETYNTYIISNFPIYLLMLFFFCLRDWRVLNNYLQLSHGTYDPTPLRIRCFLSDIDDLKIHLYKYSIIKILSIKIPFKEYSVSPVNKLLKKVKVITVNYINNRQHKPEIGII
ncbi:hypothetical protein QTP88_022138 [Uroleucon formosanum]